MTGETTGGVTMFNSQKINNDPKPWINEPTGKRWADDTTQLPPETPVRYASRPEYDNNPNPILVAFRGDLKTKQPYWSEMDIIKRWHGVNGLSTKTGEYPAYKGIWSLMEAYPDHVEHARKVLKRLVNVYGGEN